MKTHHDWWFAYNVVILSLITALIFVGVMYALEASKDEPKPAAIHKLTQISDANSVAAVINTHFKLPQRKPEIVWQDPKTGDTLSEKFIKSQYKSPKLQRAAFKALRTQGIRRVFEVCRGLSEPTNRWSFGYCTYTDAPNELEG